MTANSLRYAEYVETKRHNLAMEQETQRTNLANEYAKYMANEVGATQASAALTQAAVAGQRAAEEARHNLVTEWANAYQLDQNQNKLEHEWNFKNQELDIERGNLVVSEWNAETNAMNADTRKRELAVTGKKNEVQATASRVTNFMNTVRTGVDLISGLVSSTRQLKFLD